MRINTSGINSFYKEIMPLPFIIKKYRSLGGELITLASDAHIPKNVANGFPQAIKMLTEIGFNSYYYYQNRKPKEVKI